MDLTSLPKNASSLKFSKHNAHVMSLCLTLHINLGFILKKKTSQALKDLYNINISHQQIANYCKTASICIKPFVDHYDYKPGKVLTADETYIKVRGIKAYIWFYYGCCKPLYHWLSGIRQPQCRSLHPRNENGFQTFSINFLKKL